MNRKWTRRIAANAGISCERMQAGRTIEGDEGLLVRCESRIRTRRGDRRGKPRSAGRCGVLS